MPMRNQPGICAHSSYLNGGLDTEFENPQVGDNSISNNAGTELLAPALTDYDMCWIYAVILSFITCNLKSFWYCLKPLKLVSNSGLDLYPLSTQ